MSAEPLEHSDRKAGPLAGIRVLDMTAVVLGPLATQILGDYGAEVIKVESPAGDLMRAGSIARHPGMASVFLNLNRNKRSLCLDLRQPEGAAVLRRIVPRCDVLVHNMRVEAIERLGFGYKAVAALRPDIVYCVATGFDEDGPDAGKPAFDDVIQAASGLVAITGLGKDAPDFMPTLLADKTTGLMLVNAVLAALFHRQRTGAGQYVEVPMLETMAAFVLAEHMGAMTFEPQPAPAGYVRILAGGRSPSPTKDGYIGILPYTLDRWTKLLEAVGRPELAALPLIADREQRTARSKEVYALLATITRTRTTAEWMTLLHELDIPATPVYGLDDLPDHPQLKATGLFQIAEHPSEGTVRYTRPTTKFAASPASVRSLAPKLGQHNSDILREIGYGEEEIAGLRARNILVQKE
ncbi:MAG TPA: CoA transferase [Stellaceae bacterium]|jgi:formyl-CoA transferase|nr:CoA transferase [Stellaceae bacterium]